MHPTCAKMHPTRYQNAPRETRWGAVVLQFACFAKPKIRTFSNDGEAFGFFCYRYPTSNNLMFPKKRCCALLSTSSSEICKYSRTAPFTLQEWIWKANDPARAWHAFAPPLQSSSDAPVTPPKRFSTAHLRAIHFSQGIRAVALRNALLWHSRKPR